jgi:L-ascorbate metabolism protein UlaG (beta-lactamase superfamily)
VDVLLIPVGDTFTIDALKAQQVVEQLRPRLMVVPMHYKTPASTIKELEPLAPFIDRKTNVRREPTPTIALSPMKARPAAEIVVLPYR